MWQEQVENIGTIRMRLFPIQITHKKMFQWLNGFRFWEKVFSDLVAFAYNEPLNINNITSELKYTGFYSINERPFIANDFGLFHIAELSMIILSI